MLIRIRNPGFKWMRNRIQIGDVNTEKDFCLTNAARIPLFFLSIEYRQRELESYLKICYAESIVPFKLFYSARPCLVIVGHSLANLRW